MKRNIIKKVFFSVLLVFSIFVMTVSTAYASDYSLQISLPIKQEFTVKNKGTNSVNQTGIYELTAISENAPLPKDSKDGKYVFSIEGAKNQVEIPINYDKAGLYSYTLKQITEDAKYYNYDRKSYKINVYVQNEEDGSFSSQVIVEDLGNAKCDEITFTNSYKGKPIIVSGDPVLTGNTINIVFWSFLAVVSLVTILVLSYKGKGRNKSQKQKM